MRFEYAAWIGVSTDTGEPTAFFRPIVDLIIRGPDRVVQHKALVDTGADTCYFPSAIATQLGIEEQECRGPAATSATGDAMSSTYADVDIELTNGQEHLAWRIRGYFHEAADDSDQLLILGHSGFLEYFTAHFIGEEFALELEPNEYLPAHRESNP